MISWDETKRLANIRQHGIDFADLEAVFDHPMLTIEDRRARYGELRLQSLANHAGRVILLVWTARDDHTAHLISCRYATRSQAKNYFEFI